MEEPLTAWANLLKVHAALVPELDRELRQAHDLPLTWYDLLVELNNAKPDRRRTRWELCVRVVVISRTRLSRVVDELAGAGLVTRETNPADRRSSYAVLTDAGRDRLRRAAPTYLAGIQRRFAEHLNPREAHTVATALRRVLTANTDPDATP
jgi:DNA-binding MarR family transcriptional regulator